MINPTAAARECSDAWNAGNPFQYGDPFSISAASLLSNVGASSFAKLLNDGTGFNSFFPKNLLLAIILSLAFVLLFEVVVSILASVGLCNAAWASKIGLVFFYREKKKTSDRAYRFRKSVFSRKLKLFAILTFIFLLLYIAAIGLGSMFVINTFSETQDLRCHGAQVQMELERGLVHNISNANLDWLPHMNESYQYTGFKNFERLLPDLVIVNSTVESYMQEILSYMDKFHDATNHYAESFESVIKVNATGKDLNQYICISKMLLERPEVAQMKSKFLELKAYPLSSYPDLVEQRVQYINAANNFKSSISKLRQVVDYVQNIILEYLDQKFDPVKSHSFFLCIIYILTIVALLFSFFIYVSLVNHARKYVTPDPYTYARLLGTSWVFFTITAICSLGMMIWLINTNSYFHSACSFVKSVPGAPGVLHNYNLTQQFIDDPLRERLIDKCVANPGEDDSELVNIVMPGLRKYHKDLEQLPKQLWSQIITPLFDDASIQTTDSMILVSNYGTGFILNTLDPTLFDSDNVLYLPQETFGTILPAGATSTKMSLTNVLPPTIVDSMQRRDGLLKAYQSEFSEFDISLSCIHGTPVPQTLTQSYESILREIEYAVRMCSALENTFSFCVTINNQQMCSNNTLAALPLYMITNTSITSVTNEPFWESNFTGFEAEPRLEKFLAECKKRNIKPGPTCQAFWINTAYNGIRLLGKMTQNENKCEVDTAAAKELTGIQTIAHELRSTFLTDKPLLDIDKTYAFRATPNPMIIGSTLFRKKLNCAAVTQIVGELVEHGCGLVVSNYVYLLISVAVLAILSIISWILSYRGYLYFLKAQKWVTRGLRIKDAENPAHWFDAIKKNADDREVLYDLLDGSPVHPFSAQNDMDSGVLHYAAYMGDKKTVELLLKQGADINVQNARGYTPVSIAVSEGHADLAEYLVMQGADPCIRDEFGDTPLHSAARAGDLKCVKALCNEVAPPPTYRNNEDQYAIDIAEKQGHQDVTTLLGPLSPRH